MSQRPPQIGGSGAPNQPNANVLPRDAKIISLLLKNHGIDECEPKVIQMLIEFAYKHTLDILQESLIYADHAERRELSIDDIRLAIQKIVNTTFVTPPTRESLSKAAAEKNSIPLPVVDNDDPIKLPREDQCLLAPHYKVTSLKIPPSASKKV